MILSMLLALTLNTQAGGNRVGNGADDHSTDITAAWFADPARTIKYCIQVGPQFGVPEPEIRKTVATAFKIWKDYAANRIPELTFKSSYQKCNGTEDLKFYMGDVFLVKGKYFYVPETRFGIAIEESFDQKQNWGKGLIWIKAADSTLRWSSSARLMGVVLHELGHVFGCGHVPGTIMREDLDYELLNGNSPDWSFTQINFTRQLVLDTESEYEFIGQFNKSHTGPFSFKSLMERLSQKWILASYLKSKKNFSGVFKIQDLMGSREFQVTDVNILSFDSNNMKVFNRRNGGAGTKTYSSSSLIATANMHVNGGKIPLLMAVNRPSGVMLHMSEFPEAGGTGGILDTSLFFWAQGILVPNFKNQ